MDKKKSLLNDNRVRIAAIVILIAVAVFGVYRFANVRNANAEATTNTTTASVAASGTQTSTAGSAGCCATGQKSAAASGTAASSGTAGCCGTGQKAAAGGGSAATGPAATGTAAVNGNVQKISVKVGATYDPSVIKLKSGVPAEITFGQSQGCTGYVQSQDLNFGVDLTSGPQTVKLPGLQPGTYNFACGMNMVRGQIVVE
jgi:hypothetical protein